LVLLWYCSCYFIVSLPFLANYLCSAYYFISGILQESCLALVEEEISSSRMFYSPFKDFLALLLKDLLEVGSSTGAVVVVIKESECPE
jgi:hypothetical protein